MERILFQNVWKQYDRRFGSNRFRRLAMSLLGRHPERNEFWALRDVSFRLEEGESLGIVGPNGSGKTTILRILSGISHINRGSVRVRGSISALIALGAGFHPELTGRENIYLNGSILGLKRREIQDYFEDIVDFAGIGEYIDAPVKRYSSGMFVRLGFAVAAQVRPDVLLVDEVLAVGDARFQTRCHERIRQLREQGTIIVLVSHDLWAIRRSCQKGIFLRKGEIQAAGAISDVLAAYNDSIQSEGVRRIGGAGEDGRGADQRIEMAAVDASGREISEIPLGAELRLRLTCRCEQPVRRPVLVISAAAHHGPTAMILRSRKTEWSVDELSGKSRIEVRVPQLRLNPGAYAFQAALKDENDFATLTTSPICEFFVRLPHPDWCEENCFYVPEAEWSGPWQVNGGDSA